MHAPAELVTRHLWIVEHFCARYRRQAPESADLRAAGTHGLCEAAAKFKPKKGRVFSTYAWNWVKGYTLSEVRRCHVVPVPEHTARRALKEGKPIRRVVAFGADHVLATGVSCYAGNVAVQREPDQEAHSDRMMRVRAVRQCIREIDDKLARQVVRRVLQGKSVAQIARALRLSQTRVAELLAAAEHELRELMT